MVVKTKLKKKVKKPIKQKQTQKQIQNVNQIVRIYLDERRKKKVKKTAPRKKVVGVGSSNINMSPFLPPQNPIYNMYPLTQPYNPNFYPKRPQKQPEKVSVPQNAVPNTTPSGSQDTPIPAENISVAEPTPQPIPQPFIPPVINVPTNPLVAEQPINNFPNLQNDMIDLPIVNEDVTDLGVVDDNNDNLNIGNMDTIPLMDDNPRDTFAEDFNSGLGYSKSEDPDLIADQELADAIRQRVADQERADAIRQRVADRFAEDEEVNAMMEQDINQENAEVNEMRELAYAKDEYDNLLILLGEGKGRGRTPSTASGYKKKIEELKNKIKKIGG